MFAPLDPFWFLLLGIIVGSFLNVVIYRYNTGATLGGRSKCLACGKKLFWYELIPLASFLWQSGRCRGCRTKISWQYPLVELITGLSFFLVWQLELSLVSKLVYLLIACLFVVIAAYDWRHLIIPNGPVYAFIILALGHSLWLSLVVSPYAWSQLFNYVLTGCALAAFFWILWWLSRGRWLGFADGKLALGIGFWLGPVAGVSAVVLAFWLGAVVGLALMLVSRLLRRRGRVTMKSELPFAPFLVLGTALVVFWHLNVIFF